MNLANKQLFEEWIQAFVVGLGIILGAAFINASLSRHMKNTKYAERYSWNERVWIEGPHRPRFYGTSTNVGKTYLFNSFIPRKYLAHLTLNLYTRAIKSKLLTSIECINLNKTLLNFIDVFNGRLDFKKCLVFHSTNEFDNSALLSEILEFIIIIRARKIVTKFHNYSYEIVMSPVIVNSYKNGHNSYQIVK